MNKKTRIVIYCLMFFGFFATCFIILFYASGEKEKEEILIQVPAKSEKEEKISQIAEKYQIFRKSVDESAITYLENLEEESEKEAKNAGRSKKKVASAHDSNNSGSIIIPPVDDYFNTNLPAERKGF